MLYVKPRSEDNLGRFPTWAAYNSLTTDTQPLTRCEILPLTPGSPTDWSNLYTALKLVQGINIQTSQKLKTIVTLDLQLYSKCMQLREKNEIYSNFVFRLGELHIVFAMLKVIGKYIENSGIDRLFVEAGIYGETTLGQILEGKHMKRGVEAFLTIYLSLFRLYVSEFIKIEENLELKDQIELFIQHSSKNKEQCKNIQNQILQSSAVKDFFELKKQADNKLVNQGKFLFNIMDLVGNLLLFIRASRQGLWELHLSSLNEFAKFFFVHDQLNYARMTPLYLADMMSLKESNSLEWKYLKNNFTISKSNIPFTSIGSDHAMEQINKDMKVTGGITGLTQQPNALNRFCLAIPLTSSLSKEFCQMQSIGSQERKDHYQLSGTTCARVGNNIKKLLTTMKNFDISFDTDDCAHNVVTKVILPQEIAALLIDHSSIG